ncbi:septum formation initiator family protein [Haliovirga abyssi]|uniref:Septum formation initiator family protein n=1 Tax=Haliovirga abyssi TaxID=2996794 RepID=A0AAU9DDQ7_9FUSO|nr:septum formation initiator family protein [Haliovirga abyssi]BDU50477.1 hypothetical protein HLVA_10460 [Haliovirga abyssi]
MNSRKIKKTFLLTVNLALSIFAIKIIFESITLNGEILKTKNKIKIKKEEVAKLEKKHEELKKEYINLDNPKFIEKIAREKLFMKKKSEKVYRMLK